MLDKLQLADFVFSLRKLRERGFKGKKEYLEVMDILEDATRYDGERGSIEEAVEDIQKLIWNVQSEKGSP